PVDSPGLEVDVQGRRIMHTSDLGRLEAGVLTVLGRADDIIVSGGTNVSPPALEIGLLPSWQREGIAEMLVTWVPDAEWGKRSVALVRFAEPLRALVPPPPEITEPLRELAQPLRQITESPRELARRLTALDHGMSGQLLPQLVFAVDEIPSRSIGKPDRQAAAELAAELDATAAEYPCR